MKRKRTQYPIGSVISGTMRPEDLIPAFANDLADKLRNNSMSRAQRKSHSTLVRDCDRWSCEDPNQPEPEDLLADLFDALECYAGPYMYFGAHPGDGADYGYWLSEQWDEDFDNAQDARFARDENWRSKPTSIKVSDLSDVPVWFRGEVAVVNDHGNVTLYVKSSRGYREVWSIV
jgi:hypothetical protein